MKKLEEIREQIKHQDFRLRTLTKPEIFDTREIESLERSMRDIQKKFESAAKRLKLIKLDESKNDQKRLKKSIDHYNKKFAENKSKLKKMIDDYLKQES